MLRFSICFTFSTTQLFYKAARQGGDAQNTDLKLFILIACVSFQNNFEKSYLQLSYNLILMWNYYAINIVKDVAAYLAFC